MVRQNFLNGLLRLSTFRQETEFSVYHIEKSMLCRGDPTSGRGASALPGAPLSFPLTCSQ